MTDVPRLDAYHFYEDEWASYGALRRAFEWEIPDAFNMADYVCDRWAEGDDRVALFAEDETGGERTVTFRELAAVTNQLANFFASHGVGRGDRIGINAPQRPETAIAHIAAWKLGAVSVPLSTLFGPDALSYRLADAGAVVGVVDASNIESYRRAIGDVDSVARTITIDVDDPETGEIGWAAAIADRSRAFDSARTTPDDDAMILYTSGTTGPPKGGLHGHRLLLGNLPQYLTTTCNLTLTDRDVFWMPSEWAWIGTLFTTVFPSLYYGRPVLAYNGGAFDPVTAFELLEKYGITVVFVPPTGLRMMMQVDNPAERWDLASVRLVASGGEQVGQTVVDWAARVFEAPVHEAYGQTEAHFFIGDCTALVDFKPGTTGVAEPGHDAAVVDPDTAEPLDPGEVGEIAIRYEGDPTCFTGYWNNPEATAAIRTNAWQRTGDLGSVDEDGYFSFVGRKDDVIISAGYRIGPEEIEDTLAAHDAVADAGVIGVPDAERGEVPKAFVVLAAEYEGSPSLASTLQQYVRERLAQYEYPREIAFLDELPLTVTGKVRRAELRAREGLD